jgi:hypothetical protein
VLYSTSERGGTFVPPLFLIFPLRNIELSSRGAKESL